MNWSGEQQRLLGALGYTLWRRAIGPSVGEVAGVSAASAAAATAPVGDPLWRALQRAAGGRDLAALALPPLERLRASGREKRALWPVLRALRRP